MLSVFKSFIFSALITAIFVFTSEVAAGTFSTIWVYSISNLTNTTTGEVVVSDIRRYPVAGERYDVQYTYDVDGKSYRSALVKFDAKTRDISKLLKKYPVGAEVLVHYDPMSPSYSSLEIGKLGMGLYRQLGILSFTWLFVFAIHYFYVERW